MMVIGYLLGIRTPCARAILCLNVGGHVKGQIEEFTERIASVASAEILERGRKVARPE